MTLAGAGIVNAMLAAATNSSISNSEQQFMMASSFSYFGLPALGIIIFLVGNLIFFLAHIGTKKKSVIAGAVVTLIGIIGMYIPFLIGSGDTTQTTWEAQVAAFQPQIYYPLYQIMTIILVVGTLIYYIGIIKHRKDYKLGMVTGLLMVGGAVANLVLGMIVVPSELPNSTTFLYNISSLGGAQDAVDIHFVIILIMNSIFALNALTFSFCKIVEVHKEGDDELSIDKGSAFASYVDESAGYTPQTFKGDDIDFEF